MIEKRLQVVKALEDVEVSECQSCSFEVTLNLAYVKGTWTRDGMQLKSKPSCQISTHGKKHSLILKRVALVDAGLFAFQADGIQTSGRLSVRGEKFHHCLLDVKSDHAKLGYRFFFFLISNNIQLVWSKRLRYLH